MRFWVGAYAPDTGSAEGIGILQAGEHDALGAGGPLGMVATAAAVPGSASWLAAHPANDDILYAAVEFDGTVQAFRRASETRLTPSARPSRPAVRSATSRSRPTRRSSSRAAGVTGASSVWRSTPRAGRRVR